MGLEEAWPFCKPLSKEIYTDYYDVIKNPKTLQDIQNVNFTNIFNILGRHREKVQVFSRVYK